MERLIHKAYILLNDEFNCTLIGPKGAHKFLDSTKTFYGCRFAALFFLPCAFLKGILATKRDQYDLILAGSGLSAMPAMLISKIRNIPFITYVHGLDLSFKNIMYQSLFLPTIKASNKILVNSSYTEQVALNKDINKDKIIVLNPGVEIASNSNDLNEGLYSRIYFENKKVLLTVGRLIERKGIAHFIRQSLPLIVKNHPDVIYLIAGEEPDKIKKKHTVLNDIHKAIYETSLNKHIMLLGRVDDNDLIALYRLSDLFIFPVISDPYDIEGFGMVAIEAASNGTPTIAFNSGGISDSVCDNISGKLIQPNDYLMLANTVNSYLNGELNELTQESCQNFSKRFSWILFKSKLTMLCKMAISEKL